MSTDYSIDERRLLSSYHFASAEPLHTDAYITPSILNLCRRLGINRVLDIGCGNGALCATLVRYGIDAVGCDPSSEGIALARRAHPRIRFYSRSVYDDPGVFDGDSLTRLSPPK